MKERPKLNEELLLKIAGHISEHPMNFHMGTWCSPKGVTEVGADGPYQTIGIEDCATQACLAGWTVLLSTPGKERLNRWQQLEGVFDLRSTTWSKAAQQLLGLTGAEAKVMFLTYLRTSEAEGVCIALRKIRGLLDDRENFIKNFNDGREWTTSALLEMDQEELR